MQCVLLFKTFSDLGEFIRHKVAIGFPQGESSKVDLKEWTHFVEHLENIANNKSLKNNPRNLKSTATGLSVEECKEIVSTDFLAYVQGQAISKTDNSDKKQ